MVIFWFCRLDRVINHWKASLQNLGLHFTSSINSKITVQRHLRSSLILFHTTYNQVFFSHPGTFTQFEMGFTTKQFFEKPRKRFYFPSKFLMISRLLSIPLAFFHRAASFHAFLNGRAFQLSSVDFPLLTAQLYNFY